MKNYHINIFYSEEDDGYIADIPDLKYCSAFGLTEEEALREVLQAKAAWLDAAKLEGKPTPEPRYRPANLPDSVMMSREAIALVKKS